MKKKKIRFAVVLSSVVALTTVFAASAFATPVTGHKWSTRFIKFTNNGSNTAYQDIWTTAQIRWNDVTNVSIGSGSQDNLTTGNTSNGTVTWDGIAYMNWSLFTGYHTSGDLYVNTYYTSTSSYTPDIIKGISTHEFGHALGLDHAASGDVSVMVPYTFNIDGQGNKTDARIFKYPTPPDINTINVLYPKPSSLTSSSSDTNITTEFPANILERAKQNNKQLISVHTSWAYGYSNLKARANAADLVVLGQVVEEKGVKTEKLPDGYTDYKTQSKLQVNEVLKGDVNMKETSIILSQIGGETENTIVYHDKTTVLNKNDKVVLFLKKVGDNEYIPINENESIYSLNTDGTLVNADKEYSMATFKSELK